MDIISAGYWHCIAIKFKKSNNRQVYDTYGKLGGSIVSYGADYYDQVSKTPTGNNFISVSAGDYHSIALKKNGSIVSWGKDDFDQVSDTPIDKGYVQISASGRYSMALRRDGAIISWGQDEYNQVSGTPKDKNYVFICANLYTATAIRSDGSLVSWGNIQKQSVFMINSKVPFVHMPIITDLGVNIQEANIKQISISDYLSVVLKKDGIITTWGYNKELKITDNTSFVQVAVSDIIFIGLKKDCSILIWNYLDQSSHRNCY